MSGFEYDNSSDGEWEGRNEMEWNEFDWQQFLKRNDDEIHRFLTLYLKTRHQPGHLDDVARQMGWEEEDWAPAMEEVDTRDDQEELPEDEPSDLADDVSSFEPFTLHRHPVYIVSRGIYLHLSNCWGQFVYVYPQHVSPTLALEYNKSLHQGETNAMMAVSSLDVGDFALAVCHFKNAIAAVNHSLGLLQKLPAQKIANYGMFEYESHQGLFDLRDLWLRVMRECREEARRPRED